MPEATIDQFTPEEQDIFRQLTTTTLAPNQLIPMDMDPARAWKNLLIASKLVRAAEEAIAKLKPYIGRLLVLVRENPFLYEEHGYRTFNDFMTDGMPALFKISRAEAYNCLKVARELGFLSADQLTEIGFAKLNVLASIVKNDIPKDAPVEMVEKKRDEWVQAAATMTINDLITRAETRNVIEEGQFDKHTISIVVDTPTKDFWEKMIKSPEVAAYCETTTPGFILRRMMEESYGEWVAQATDSIRGVRH